MTGRAWFVLLFFGVGMPLAAETLASRDIAVLATADGTSLGSLDDPTVQLVEAAGQKVVLRLSPVDASGHEIGSGRVVLMLPSETREIRLRDRFAPEALESSRLKVEILRGEGRVSVTAGDSSGRNLIPEPNAAARRRRAVAPPVPRPSSGELIDAAEASGALDHDTALLDRVYLLFGDARLPAEFRGEDTPIIDSPYMEVVRQQFATLSPAMQAAVQPFLVPPAYKDSWVNVRSGSPVQASDTPPPCQFFSDRWAFVDAQTSPVRVWYEADSGEDALAASRAATEVDKFWSREIDLMHRPGTATGFPVSDAAESCSGGDSRLDIYLTDLSSYLAGITIPFSFCGATAAYIELERDVPIGTLIHEVFHAIQDSFPVSGCFAADDYRWWFEGGATWAEDYVESALYPGIQSEHGWASKYMQDRKIQLDIHEDPLRPYHGYSTYLLPFYIWHSTGNADFVRVAWENCAREPAIEALDHALPGGLDAVWPEFAKRNWNKPPVDDYKNWDKITYSATLDDAKVMAATSDITIHELDYELPHTSAIYYDLDLSGAPNPSVVFWNGVTTKLAERDISGGAIGPQYVNDAAGNDEIKGAHVSALIRRGEAWTQEDWTSRPYVAYCRDNLAERIDELVLIISSSEFADRSRKLKPPGLPPFLFVSNVGCAQWKGTVSFSSPGVMTTADVTFKPDQSSGPPFIHFSAEGGLTWSVSAQGCNASGSATLGTASLTLYNFLPPDNPAHGTYVGAGVSPLLSVCGGSYAFPWWTVPAQPFLPGIPNTRWLRVSGNGRTMDDTSTVSPAAWHWHLEAQRQ